jgi:hypothetical protein
MERERRRHWENEIELVPCRSDTAERLRVVIEPGACSGDKNPAGGDVKSAISKLRVVIRNFGL